MQTTDRSGAGAGRTYGTYLNYIVAVSALGLLMVAMVAFVSWRQEHTLPSVDYQADLAALVDLADYQVYAPDPAEVPEGWTPTSSRLHSAEDRQNGASPAPVTESTEHTGVDTGDPGADDAAPEPEAQVAGDTASEDTLTWELGFATASDEYAALWISDRDPEPFRAQVTENGTSDGTTDIDGRTWERTINADGDRRSLVLAPGGNDVTADAEDRPATIVVTGTADYGELEDLATVLSAHDSSDVADIAEVGTGDAGTP
ncbi:DUF4245 domain-containing protein [Lipingzhangella sp. LS1_29]|uniref:DUF4245 domain-containing protein n=1 Tax=Lipingzhangella rawalii TaxID=2055835 RepID=A0ABU2HBC5_9ACTN|nr:DUF4245 domain-containing protein [Lipingzhangella rawalii]MDS1272130.1 DUF4245 domain-containing protein [Lipingzhangella rawalii]